MPSSFVEATSWETGIMLSLKGEPDSLEVNAELPLALLNELLSKLLLLKIQPLSRAGMRHGSLTVNNNSACQQTLIKAEIAAGEGFRFVRASPQQPTQGVAELFSSAYLASVFREKGDDNWQSFAHWAEGSQIFKNFELDVMWNACVDILSFSLTAAGRSLVLATALLKDVMAHIFSQLLLRAPQALAEHLMPANASRMRIVTMFARIGGSALQTTAALNSRAVENVYPHVANAFVRTLTQLIFFDEKRRAIILACPLMLLSPGRREDIGRYVNMRILEELRKTLPSTYVPARTLVNLLSTALPGPSHDVQSCMVSASQAATVSGAEELTGMFRFQSPVRALSQPTRMSSRAPSINMSHALPPRAASAPLQWSGHLSP
jgi:hypothetical protein